MPKHQAGIDIHYKSRNCWYIERNEMHYFLSEMLFIWCRKSIQPKNVQWHWLYITHQKCIYRLEGNKMERTFPP